ncbi:MAG TPA: hypothetical protein VFR37_22275 [Longimicrobium sp.]|nr:hypothetical protein [Longimicrobium sp.]
MARSFANRKKVRGWKRRIRQLERLRLAHRELDVDALRAGYADYVQIWLDPWSRLVPRNPPYWYRRRILGAFIDIHDAWREALERLGEPYYLELWLFHPDFHRTQVVAALDPGRMEHYRTVFPPAEHAAPRPPAPYDDAAYDLDRFRWRAGTEIHVLVKSLDVVDAEDEARLTREADRVEQASTGDTLYIFELGTVWQGSTVSDPSTWRST